MDNNENKKQKIESLIETSRQVKAEANKSSSKKKSQKKGKKNFFLAPSFVMFFICFLAIMTCAVAAGVTSYRISEDKEKAMATPTLVPEGTPVPTPFPTPKGIPNVSEVELLSEELYSLTATCTEWNKKDEKPEDTGLYFIEQEAEYLVYHVDANNLCASGETFADYEYIWVNSEDNDFAAVINISGEIVDLSGYYILARDETSIYAPRVIFNCYDAKEVYLNDTIVTGTILAPNAKIICKDTYVYGQLIGDSYEGNLAYIRDIAFSEYLNVMSVTHGVDFENLPVKKRIIEILKTQDTDGTYKDYTLETVVLEKDIKKILDLDLSGLQISDFGNDLMHFSHVISLDLGNNRIKSVDLSLFPNLQALYVNSTSIHKLNLEYCPALKILDISNTRMDFTPDFNKVPRLEYLAASNAAFSGVNYGALQNLSRLDVSYNPLIKDFDFEKLPKLEQLDISYCALERIDLKKATALKFLKCSGNLYTVLNLDDAPALKSVEAYTETLTKILAVQFYKRNENVTLLYYTHIVDLKNN